MKCMYLANKTDDDHHIFYDPNENNGDVNETRMCYGDIILADHSADDSNNHCVDPSQCDDGLVVLVEPFDPQMDGIIERGEFKGRFIVEVRTLRHGFDGAGPGGWREGISIISDRTVRRINLIIMSRDGSSTNCAQSVSVHSLHLMPLPGDWCFPDESEDV